MHTHTQSIHTHAHTAYTDPHNIHTHNYYIVHTHTRQQQQHTPTYTNIYHPYSYMGMDYGKGATWLSVVSLSHS